MSEVEAITEVVMFIGIIGVSLVVAAGMVGLAFGVLNKGYDY